MHIEKSIDIDVPVDKVYSYLKDFNNWQAWSPWLIMEPECKVDVEEGGKAYSWDGVRIGSGEMSITNEDENKRLDMDLTFLKPWKSHAKVWFELRGNGDKTNLSWSMDSSIPIFIFWMAKTITAAVGMDYERGLRMLKEQLETGHNNSKVEYNGTSNYGGCKYVGIKRHSKMEDMGKEMGDDLMKLGQWAESHKDDVQDVPFTIYHKFDMVKGDVEYTSGIPVKEIPAGLDSKFVTGEIPPTEVYTVTHTGSYSHLGNAWSAGVNAQQNKLFKPSKKVHPFEVYPNSPHDTKEEDLVTQIHFPVK